MPNYHAELIRALQPFVAGYEALFGTSRFVQRRAEPKPPGSLTLYSLTLLIRAPFELLMAFVRFAVDWAFALVLLVRRLGTTLGLRARWGKARHAAKAHGLLLPRYSPKGRIFTIDETGKPHTLADLQDIAPRDIKKAVMRAAEQARGRARATA